jgi:hypothetical protein
MPSLRGHMVFMSVLRDALERELPALGAIVAEHWPAALAGSEGPDAWYFSGQQRPETHGLDMEDPATWAGAIPTWLERHPEMRPGRAQPPEVAAFVAGYLSHLGLDTWEQYQHEELPFERRAGAPAAWYPRALADRDRLRAALRRLGEAPFPAGRRLTPEALGAAPVPAQFAPDAVRRVAAGIAPALPLEDPWEISRVNPLRDLPRTPDARAAWERERAELPEATPAEYAALLDAASAFTLDAIRAWW